MNQEFQREPTVLVAIAQMQEKEYKPASFLKAWLDIGMLSFLLYPTVQSEPLGLTQKWRVMVNIVHLKVREIMKPHSQDST